MANENGIGAAVAFQAKDNNENLLNTVLTQEPTIFPAENKTLVQEAKESKISVNEKLNQVSNNISGVSIKNIIRDLNKI